MPRKSKEPKPRKWLCICEGGNNRSGAMSLQLKMQGQDSIQAGWKYNTKETLQMLADWADYVIIMQPVMKDELANKGVDIPEEKLRCVDVGLDTYGYNTHMGLNERLKQIVIGWYSRGWVI